MAAIKLTPEERFWSKVDKSGDCWIWTGYRLPSGYGRFNIDGKRVEVASRVAFFWANGAWPRFACHHCDNPSCVNPSHLYDGTPATNMRDMVARGRHYLAGREACARGHRYSEHPPRVITSRGRTERQCVVCAVEYKRRHAAKRRAAHHAQLHGGGER